MSEEGQKPGGRSRRPGRQVRRAGRGDEPQASLPQLLENAGIDPAALRRLLGAPDMFSEPWDPQAARQASMAFGTLIRLGQGNLEKIVERDPEMAPVAMGRVQRVLEVCVRVLGLYAMQGTRPRMPEEDESGESEGNPDAAGRTEPAA